MLVIVALCCYTGAYTQPVHDISLAIEHIWGMLPCLISVWCSPLYGMSVIPFLTLATSVILDIIMIPIYTFGKGVVILNTDNLSRGSGMVGPINLV